MKLKIPTQEYTGEFKELAAKRVKAGQGIGAVARELGLAEQRISEDTARNAAHAAIAGAAPLSKNAYKLPVFEALVRRTILSATSRL